VSFPAGAAAFFAAPRWITDKSHQEDEMKHVLRVATLAAIVALAGCGGDNGDGAEVEGQVASSAVPFDRAFIDGMVQHHEGAIEMAKSATRAGLSQPDLVQIADDIIRDQQDEIDDMRGWREDWFGSSAIDPQGADTLGLSPSEMGMQHEGSDLTDAADVDQAFASMMIDHHRGAIRMAELGQDRGQHEEIKELAGQIIEAQEREIASMQEHAAGHH